MKKLALVYCLCLILFTACATNRETNPTTAPAMDTQPTLPIEISPEPSPIPVKLTNTPSGSELPMEILPPLQVITPANAGEVKLLKTLELPDFSAASTSQCTVAFSQDGTLLCGVCNRNTAPVWQVETGQMLFPLLDSPSHQVVVDFHPDGKSVAIGGFTGELGLYSTLTGELLKSYEPLPTAAWDMAFSPEGDQLALASIFAGVYLIDTASGEPVLQFTEGAGTTLFLSVDFDPGGKTIASGTVSSGVLILNAKTGALVTNLTIQSNVGDVAFSPDGKLLASGSDDNQIRLWDTTTYQLVKTMPGHEHYVNGVAFSPDGSLVFSGSHDKRVGVWDVASGELLQYLEGHEQPILRLAVNPSGTLIASVSWDGTIRMWGVPK